MSEEAKVAAAIEVLRREIEDARARRVRLAWRSFLFGLAIGCVVPFGMAMFVAAAIANSGMGGG